MASYQHPALNVPCGHVLPQPQCVSCAMQADAPTDEGGNMQYTVLPQLDRAAEYQFSPADSILPRSEWLVVEVARIALEEGADRAERSMFIWERDLGRIGYEVVQRACYVQDQLVDVVEEVREWQFDPFQQHDKYPCDGGEYCSGPCYDLCDCKHCAGGWVANY